MRRRNKDDTAPATTPGPPWEGMQWEYLIADAHVDLNPFGLQGWELVLISFDHAVFKRPLRPLRQEPRS